MKVRLLILFLIWANFAVQAQVTREVSDRTVLLQDGARTWQPNMGIWEDPEAWKSLDLVGQSYYAFVQLERMPSADDRARLASAGLDLLEYIPHFTYYSRIKKGLSLAALNGIVRGLHPIEGVTKAAAAIWERPFPEGNVRGGQVLVRVYLHDKMGLETLVSAIETEGGKMEAYFEKEIAVKLWVPEAALEKLLDRQEIHFVELYPTQGTPDDTHGRSLHRINRMQGPNGPLGHYNGEGVSVIVRDDGIVGPHIDFKGRLNQDLATNDDPNRTHGDGVSGILGGAGNLDPDNAGMATGAQLFILNYRSDLQDAVEQLHRSDEAVIVSTSYSDGCNVGYTGNARTIDRQMWENKTLLHVFSAGNSNNVNCGYGAGNQWGNITGGHKMAKNSIATANVIYNSTIVSSSSRGPAHDGRIKPEITAYGNGQVSTFQDNTYDEFGGTSAAAPGISGVSACLNQAYREFNAGEKPEAALIKAVLLNSANDLGEPGPDFIYGFGLVNGSRSLQVLEKEQYAAVEVDQGQSQSLDITLDRPARSVRVLLHWADPQASFSANPAIVNDLDLTVEGPDQTIYYPLVLDHTPDPIKLASAAVPGVDHLNTVEQVWLRDVEAGTYRVNIGGFEVPSGAVKAWVVYDIEYDEILVSYPAGGESFEPGDTESIRWDAPRDPGNFQLSYSLDNGVNWFTIGQIGSALRTYDWMVPNSSTGQARFRITRADSLIGESGPFSIFQRPDNIEVISACPDGITLRCDSIPGATAFTGYILGEHYMEAVAFSDSNVITIPVNSPEEGNWLALSAEGEEGRRSKRTVAIYYDGGLLNCALSHDLRMERIVSPTPGEAQVCLDEETLVTVQIVNNGTSPQSDFPVYYQVNDDTPVMELYPGTINAGERVNYTFQQAIVPADARTIEVWYELTENDYSYDDRLNADLMFVDRYEEELPYMANFDNFDSLLLTWLVEPSNEEVNWVTTKAVQADGTEGWCLTFSNFEGNFKQVEFGTQTGKIDLSEMKNPWLFFDISYANRDTVKEDQLALEISTDCGNTFERVLLYNREQMNTWNALPLAWLPRRGRHWRTDSLDISSFAGEAVVLRWVNISGLGNNVFLDNFKIVEKLSSGTRTLARDINRVVIAPNPVDNQLGFQLDIPSGSNLDVRVFDASGRQVRALQTRVQSGSWNYLNLEDLDQGAYILRIESGTHGVYTGKFVKL